ncbi:MAG: cytochrome P460 family protein [Chloroflexi bacterium]|nr:cytochrome P460 family protein [Chloroflexota bacterium]
MAIKLHSKNRSVLSGIIAISIIILFVSGCTSRPALPEPAGGDLYNYITSTAKYTEWKMWPGKQALYPGTEPHGMLLTTYVTDGAFSAITGKIGNIPEGGIIVKENYMPDRTLAAITVMYKVKGYDSANNDWFWLKYAPDGTIDVQGKVQMCIDCHGQQKANDYIWTSGLK